jgi:hypothetical protein
VLSGRIDFYSRVLRGHIMADPVTILGAAAAATQLAAQAFSLAQFLHGLYGKLDTAPAEARMRISDLEQLFSIARLIETTRSLQTPEITGILGVCLRNARVVHENLSNLSPDGVGKLKKLLRTVKIVYKEDEVAGLLLKLESGKKSLALAIHQVDA